MDTNNNAGNLTEISNVSEATSQNEGISTTTNTAQSPQQANTTKQKPKKINFDAINLNTADSVNNADDIVKIDKKADEKAREEIAEFDTELSVNFAENLEHIPEKSKPENSNKSKSKKKLKKNKPLNTQSLLPIDRNAKTTFKSRKKTPNGVVEKLVTRSVSSRVIEAQEGNQLFLRNERELSEIESSCKRIIPREIYRAFAKIGITKRTLAFRAKMSRLIGVPTSVIIGWNKKNVEERVLPKPSALAFISKVTNTSLDQLITGKRNIKSIPLLQPNEVSFYMEALNSFVELPQQEQEQNDDEKTSFQAELANYLANLGEKIDPNNINIYMDEFLESYNKSEEEEDSFDLNLPNLRYLADEFNDDDNLYISMISPDNSMFNISSPSPVGFYPKGAFLVFKIDKERIAKNEDLVLVKIKKADKEFILFRQFMEDMGKNYFMPLNPTFDRISEFDSYEIIGFYSYQIIK